MNTQEELIKLTKPVFAEVLIDLLLKNEIVAGDGVIRVVTNVHFNEEQNILTVELSDKSTFHLKIR